MPPLFQFARKDGKNELSVRADSVAITHHCQHRSPSPSASTECHRRRERRRRDMHACVQEETNSEVSRIRGRYFKIGDQLCTRDTSYLVRRGGRARESTYVSINTISSVLHGTKGTQYVCCWGPVGHTTQQSTAVKYTVHGRTSRRRRYKPPYTRYTGMYDTNRRCR